MVRTSAFSALLLLACSATAVADGPKSNHTKVVVYEPDAETRGGEGGGRAEVAVHGQGSSGSVRRRNTDLPAGVIERGELSRELSRGIGYFLGKVRVRAVITKGRFRGWKLLGFGPKTEHEWPSALKPGDVVMRANGISLERPDQFKQVWDSLSRAEELVLDIKRQGRWIKLHYQIR